MSVSDLGVVQLEPKGGHPPVPLVVELEGVDADGMTRYVAHVPREWQAAVLSGQAAVMAERLPGRSALVLGFGDG